MAGEAIAVLDVGKTIAKLTVVDPAGRVIARAERANQRIETNGLRRLDVAGVEAWLEGALAGLPCREAIGWIVPVAHGAAAVLVGSGRARALPLDYEQAIPDAVRAAYDVQRDDFAATGSPSLPDGLNLGAQLHFLESLEAGCLDGATILLWPQYWAYRLSGVMASELSSLGSHTDLWRAFERAPSRLSSARGWADRLPPLYRADEVLGYLRPEWAERTGLSPDVKILCGVHDSNAALLAARGYGELAGKEATMLSTGTWFVAMRSPPAGGAVIPAGLSADRDCLVNIDVEGNPVPSARFMGGRELQLLGESDAPGIDDPALQERLLDAAATLIGSGAMVLPALITGSGPFPRSVGGWTTRPSDPLARSAGTALYAALMIDTMLDLIETRDRLLVEGRFARSQAMVRALAALRPDLAIFVASTGLDLVQGACRLIRPDMPPPSALDRAMPLPIDLGGYRARWRALAERESAT